MYWSTLLQTEENYKIGSSFFASFFYLEKSSYLTFMKLNAFHRIISSFLALFMFISASGISLNIHYCGQELFDYAFFGHVTTCQKKELPNSDNLSFINSSCCSFDNFKIDTSDSYKYSEFDKVRTADLIPILPLSVVKTKSEGYISLQIEKIHPPPANCLDNKIYARIQSFLIWLNL